MMSKLSGILPATPRILSTDISRAQPLRAGAPRFWGPPEMNDTLSKSILSESALDRVNWTPTGMQDMADKALPVRADDFFLQQPAISGPSLSEFAAPVAPGDFSSPAPAAAIEMGSSEVGQRLDIKA